MMPAAADVAFGLRAAPLPADYAWPLLTALGAFLPWLAQDPHAGVHPLRVSPTVGGEVLLAARAKLTLRVPASRVDETLRLAGARLDVAGRRVEVGAGKVRPLSSSPTVAAQRVATVATDVGAFELLVAGMLASLSIDARYIAGGRRRSRAGARDIQGFALCVHGLRADDSLRLQCEGLGEGRAAGWGIFIPAKTIATGETT